MQRGLTVGLGFAVRDCVRRPVLSPIWPNELPGVLLPKSWYPGLGLSPSLELQHVQCIFQGGMLNKRCRSRGICSALLRARTPAEQAQMQLMQGCTAFFFQEGCQLGCKACSGPHLHRAVAMFEVKV